MPPHVQLQSQLSFTGTVGEVTKGWWLFHSCEKNNQPFVTRAQLEMSMCSLSSFVNHQQNICCRCIRKRFANYNLSLISPFFADSELKRRMKAEKKAAEKDAKLKEQEPAKESNDQSACLLDEETLDPNVRYLVSSSYFLCYYTLHCFV